MLPILTQQEAMSRIMLLSKLFATNNQRRCPEREDLKHKEAYILCFSQCTIKEVFVAHGRFVKKRFVGTKYL